MPDQSSAATEHAILQEITAPLERLPDDPIAMVHADFPVALRGYDRMAVDAYVAQISELVAELQATRSPEAAVRRALERVGDQISGILQRAHETAEEITAQSRREAEDRLEHARAEAREIIIGAETRVKDLDADTDRIWIERHRIVEDARDLAAQLMSVAENAAERFPESTEAQPGEAFPDHTDALSGQTGPYTTPFDEEAGEEDETRVMPSRAPGGTGGTEDEIDPSAEDIAAEEAAAEEEELASPEALDETELAGENDDVEATRRYEPLSDDDFDDPPSGSEPQVRGTRASIPPASQAAHRRNTK